MDAIKVQPLRKRLTETQTALRKRPEVFAGLLALLTITALIVYWAIWADNSPPWTGFGAYDEETQGARAKTLWDWMELLIVPLAVAVGAAVISYFQKRTELDVAKKERENEREIASDRQMQATLEAYYDRMTELLLEHKLRTSASGEPSITATSELPATVEALSSPKSEVRSIARARTIAAIKALDGQRNSQLFTFLSGTELHGLTEPLIDLSAADLREANFRRGLLLQVNLKGALLSRADFRESHLLSTHLTDALLDEADFTRAALHQTSLQKAGLERAKLSWSILAGNDLSEANLSKADLSHADLRGANLSHADLRGANLSHADLRDANLSHADLRGANLSDARLSKSNVANAKLFQADLSGASFTNADLRGCTLGEANLSSAHMSGADLRAAEGWSFEQMESVAFLRGAIMPDGVQIVVFGEDGQTYLQWKAQYLAKYGMDSKTRQDLDNNQF